MFEWSEADIGAAFDRLLGRDRHLDLQQRLHFGLEEDILSDFQRLAIWVYTTAAGSYFHEFNSDNTVDYMIVLRSVLISALSFLPSFDGTVYRGMQLDTADFQEFGKIEINTFVKWSRFTSCTIDLKQVFGGNIQMMIQSRSGRILGPYSSMPDEREVLFPPGTVFAVQDLQTFSGPNPVLYLDLREASR